jgi:hypothetical protein
MGTVEEATGACAKRSAYAIAPSACGSDDGEFRAMFSR